MKEKTFWLDDYIGPAKGGYFVRNPLFEFFRTLEEKGLKPVGIKVPDGWNLEIIVEAPDDKN